MGFQTWHKDLANTGVVATIVVNLGSIEKQEIKLLPWSDDESLSTSGGVDEDSEEISDDAGHEQYIRCCNWYSVGSLCNELVVTNPVTCIFSGCDLNVHSVIFNGWKNIMKQKALILPK